MKHEKQKRNDRKGTFSPNAEKNLSTLFLGSICKKIDMSAAGSASHMRHCHQDNVHADYDIQLLDNVGVICSKVCKSCI